MNTHTELTPAASMEAEITALRRLQTEGRHAEVLERAGGHLQALPDNRDLLLLAASSHRHLRQVTEAMAVLDRLEAAHPHFSRLHQERGLCHVQRKDADPAIQALLLAVNINPALPASWSMLVKLYGMTGNAADAATAGDHVATLAALPPEVVQATSLFSDGDLKPAEDITRQYLLAHGNHPEAMRLLARIGLACDVLNDAETLLEAVLELTPDYRAARYDYAQTLIKRQKYMQAFDEIDTLLAVDPKNADYRTLAATAAVGLGQNEHAIRIYRDMLEDMPQSWDVPLWLGHALKTVGQVPDAVESYRQAARARPNFGDAYWSLANLKMYRFTDEELEVMQREEAAATTGLVDRYHLCFALGKAFEDRADFARSWAFYERGNTLKRSESRYRAEIQEINTREQIAVCTPEFFARRTGWGAKDPDPIFVVGLPRSGSTLIEQILASHSQVEGTHELSDIQRIALELQGADMDLDQPRYPGSMQDLSADEILALGRRYMSETQVYRGGKAYFIDKMPNNFRHIGLIHLMLPNAKIIDARREPMACCFSNLKQLFAQGQEFTYAIDDIARYYRTYLDLMDHWDRALPGRILRVPHEDVVDDLDGSVRRILDYCGLDFEPGCVEFHKTKRSVRTPSSEQVRQPIFRDSLDQWRNFAPWIEPLNAALGDAQVRYRTG
ncbi:tetratricopeptide repeat-containing sulfotransferase family protein [Asticcacaulis solisilvae]|uniref:tetratricopeptide repeat-containing sulfotransferase family protein n=1 Tax=Asticcacaulis solisilvae TaxID=1217274 RepID=UPI003FD8966D